MYSLPSEFHKNYQNVFLIDVLNLEFYIKDRTSNNYFKMKMFDSEECPYCFNIPDRTLHALINCPIIAQLGRRVELWLQVNVNKSIKKNIR